jgi:hypothetical protein
MKVTMFNHWFKHKVPIDDHFDQIQEAKFNHGGNIRYSNFWNWLNNTYDVGQYYNWREERNYLVFHDKNHYLIFLLKL